MYHWAFPEPTVSQGLAHRGPHGSSTGSVFSQKMGPLDSMSAALRGLRAEQSENSEQGLLYRTMISLNRGQQEVGVCVGQLHPKELSSTLLTLATISPSPRQLSHNWLLCTAVCTSAAGWPREDCPSAGQP
uniref:Uncharacterized protein n=1 Tax=Knipowitschia caucasica TaxID=637954 RepID=A0AAV2M5N7_KNICA